MNNSVDEYDYLVVTMPYNYKSATQAKDFSDEINKYMKGEGSGAAAGVKYKPVGGISYIKGQPENFYSQALIGEKPIVGGHKKPSRRKTRKNRRKY